MRIENLEKLLSANTALIRVAESKQTYLMKLFTWVNEFADGDAPTTQQISDKLSQIQMNDLQSAFDYQDGIFNNPDVIVSPNL